MRPLSPLTCIALLLSNLLLAAPGRAQTGQATPARAAQKAGPKAGPQKKAPAAQEPDQQEQAAPPDTTPHPPQIVEAVAQGQARVVGQEQADRLYCELLSAGAQGGQSVVSGIGDVPALNKLLGELAQLAGDKAPVVGAIVDSGFPLALIDTHQKLWRKKQGAYVPAFAVVNAAVDDGDGTLYAADPQRRLYSFDSRVEQWRSLGVGQNRALQASKGVLYYILNESTLWADSVAGKLRLLPRILDPGASIKATGGLLYLLDRGQLFLYSGGKWERNGSPLRTGVAALAAVGPSYYVVDQKGDLYSGADKKPLQQKLKGASLFMVGQRLLVLTPPPNSKLRGFLPDQKAWQTLR